MGDEGGFAPNVNSAQGAIELILEAVSQSKLDNKIKIALDVAASEFYNEKTKKYDLGFKENKRNEVSKEQLVDLYENLHKN